MTADELRDRLIALDHNVVAATTTVNELIAVLTLGTHWDFAETKALFYANFRTELPES